MRIGAWKVACPMSGDAARTSGPPPPRLKHTLDISEIGHKLPDSNTAVFVLMIYDMADVCGPSPNVVLYKGAIDGVVRKLSFLWMIVRRSWMNP